MKAPALKTNDNFGLKGNGYERTKRESGNGMKRRINWVRDFGFRTALRMQAELSGDWIAGVLLKLAHRLSYEMKREHEQADQAYYVAKALVYGKIDADEAKARFYGIYY